MTEFSVTKIYVSKFATKLRNRQLLHLSFNENRCKKTFFYQELLRIYKMDFAAATGIEVYIWWHQRKKNMSTKTFYIFWKHTITKPRDSSSSQLKVKIRGSGGSATQKRGPKNPLRTGLNTYTFIFRRICHSPNNVYRK